MTTWLDPLARDELDLPSARFVPLTEAEAAELGTAVHNMWLVAAPDGVHISVRDFLEVRDEAERWRSLRRLSVIAGKVLLGAGVSAGFWLALVLIIEALA